jgi:hypothetical protein
MLETHPPAMASSPRVASHLNLDAIERDLFDFPDRALLHALRYGTDMGYSGQNKSSEWPNHKSSAEAAKQIEEQIMSELKEGIIGGGGPSWEAFGFDHFRCSPLGAVAKRGTSEVWRVDDNSIKVALMPISTTCQRCASPRGRATGQSGHSEGLPQRPVR